jgi:orotate phosphoribosyltransferase
MSDSRARFVDLLKERSFERKKVILASGKESDFFIDCKQTALTAEGHWLLGEAMFMEVSQLTICDAVAGVELGGCPLASAVSMYSYLHAGPQLPALYVRKAKKDHGSQKLVEGDKAMYGGIRVVLLEDVVTTGASSLRAVDSLTRSGAVVVGIVAIVDRDEGGAAAIAAAGLPLVSLFHRRDFMGDE